MPAIPPDLIKRLRSALLRCEKLESDRTLRALFVDARIAAWRNRAPENTANRDSRVTRLIAEFCTQSDANGRNALALVLTVMAEEIPHGDSLRAELAALAGELQCFPVDILATLAELAVEAALAAALEQLATLPLDHVPDPAPLPGGSRMSLKVNPHFVGRAEDLMRLAAALKGGATAAIGQVAAATGLGGIGKTQLASEFAHRYGRFFAGGVFWLNFGDPASVPAEVANCGGPGGLEMPTAYNEMPLPDQVRLVKSAWSEPTPRLLIFDNCEDEDLLDEWRPASGGARVLVTSRLGQWSATMGVQALPLDVLPREESIALLRKHRPDLSDEDAGAIAEELGDLPLALHLAGSFLAFYCHKVTPSAYLVELRKTALKHASMQGRKADHSPTKHEQHVENTFNLSFERLEPADPTDALALKLLARAAYFAHGVPIPRELLTMTLDLPADDPEATLQAEDALARLSALGLLETDKEGDLTLHRLLAAFARETTGDEKAQAAVEETLLAEANRLNNEGFPAPLLAWQEHLRTVSDAAREREDEQAAGLCNEMGYHLMGTGDLAGARPYFERALAIREGALGSDHPNTAQSLNNLGHLFHTQGDLARARTHFERALEVNKKALGPDHPSFAINLNNLGMLLQTQGDLENAKLCLERALDIFEKAISPHQASIAQSLNNLGTLLCAQDDLTGAWHYYERALAIREKALGSDHPNTAESLGNLGVLLQRQGNLAEARSYYERTLAIREKAFGLDHPETALSLNNLGTLLYSQGNIAEAQSYFERALDIWEKALGPNHLNTALSLDNLGYLLKTLGDLAGARPYYERALAIRERALGPDHPDTATSLNNLAVLCAHEDNFEEAARLMRRALVIREAKLGLEHPNTQSSRESLEAIEEELSGA
ncbi:MAG: tetratricopeptide repeat protein [Anaerolineae bacterium]|nr:tetratricopeptide repeat protein [Anaerolineae bacterium]